MTALRSPGSKGLQSLAFIIYFYDCLLLFLNPDFEIPCDTKAAILFLKSIVPLSKFERKIPAIILKHQIYCVVKDKTLVDRQLVSLHTATANIQDEVNYSSG